MLETDGGDYPSRTIVIAAGIGAFEARRLGIEGEDAYEEKGLYFKVLDPKAFAGRRVLLVGGGDSAFDWAVNLQGVADSVMLIHRRDGFRAHAATISQVQELCRQGRCDLRTFWEVKTIEGNGKVERVTILNNKTKEEETLELDAIIPLLGFHSDLGAIKQWGLDTEKADIKVNQLMETNVPGIYAAGDITAYPGKLKLIATGASEACIAVNNAVHYINPKAKVNPGHSSNLAIFGQKEDVERKPQDRSSYGHLRPHEEPQLPRSGKAGPLHLDPHDAALGVIHPQPSRRIGEQQWRPAPPSRANGPPAPRRRPARGRRCRPRDGRDPDPRRARRQGTGGTRKAELLDQDLGRLRGPEPGTGEHQRRHQVELAQRATHLALDLAALVADGRSRSSGHAPDRGRRRRRGGSGGGAYGRLGSGKR